MANSATVVVPSVTTPLATRPAMMGDAVPPADVTATRRRTVPAGAEAISDRRTLNV